MAKKTPWSRNQRIAVWAIVVPVVLAILSLFSPEVRKYVGLEKPMSSVATAPASLVSSASPSSAPPASVTPSISETPRAKQHIAQRAKIAGNGNVNQTSTGASSPNVSTPNGIAIVGNQGTVTNPTVNNFAAPNRRLSDEQRSALLACLRTNPGAFTVNALANNSEAYRYAQDFSEVLTAAAWKNEWPTPVAVVMIGGAMWSGMRINVPGTWDVVSQHASIVGGSPEETAIRCLSAARVSALYTPYKDMTTGRIVLIISDHP